MIAKLHNRFMYLRWYFSKGRTLIVTLPIFIDVIIVTLISIYYAFLGMVAMANMGGFIIFLFGVGFVFPLFPMILAIMYSKLPILVDKRLQAKYAGISTFNRYFFILLAMIIMRLLIIFGMYVYSLIVLIK